MNDRPTLSKHFIKYFFVYSLCLFCFWACYQLGDGAATKEAVIFQLLLFWLLNELWFILTCVPVLLGTLLKWLKNRSELDDRFFWCSVRWTSLSLLIVPELIYALLSIINSAMDDALAQWLGLPLSMGLFASSFVSIVLLFILSFPAKIMGIGIIQFFNDLEYLTDDEHFVNNESRAPSLKTVAEGPIQEHHSQRASAHHQMVLGMITSDERLLLHTAPSGLDQMKDANQHRITGFVLMGCALLFTTIAVIYWQQASSALFRALPVCGAIAFGLAALPALRARSRYQSVLSNSDYFITNKAVYCCKLGRIRCVRYVDKPRFALTLYSHGYGRIDIIEAQSLAGKLLDKLQPQSLRNVQENKGFQDPLNGLVHIAQPEEVLSLIHQSQQGDLQSFLDSE